MAENQRTNHWNEAVEKLAVIESVKIGWDDDHGGAVRLWMGVAGLFGGAAICLSDTEIYKHLRANKVYDVLRLKGSVVVVEHSESQNIVRFKRFFK